MQVFGRAADLRLRVYALAAVGAALLIYIGTSSYFRSAYLTGVGWFIDQPVPFSHEHHVGGLGIDCRYCHTAVEVSASAGYPPTYTCMSCHSQIWTGAPMLAPIRQSLVSGQPIRWNRVNRVPDYVYFDHAIHISKGVGCVTCHGRVDWMPLMQKAQSFTMGWCVDCHRDPAPRLRPLDKIFDLAWQPSGDARMAGAAMLAERHIPTEHLDDCYVCHR